MRYFITTDPHGNFDAMHGALNKAGFDPENEFHMLIIGGDLFDRGTQNLLILNYVYDLLQRDKVILIRGNHDEFFKDSVHYKWNMLNNGFNTTVSEFFKGTDQKYLTSIKDFYIAQPKLKDVLFAMIDEYKIGNYVITHGGYKNNRPYNWNHTEEWITSQQNTDDGNIYIFGHWGANLLNESYLGEKVNKPFVYKNYIGLDATTARYKTSFVMIIDTEDIDNYTLIY